MKLFEFFNLNHNKNVKTRPATRIIIFVKYYFNCLKKFIERFEYDNYQKKIWVLKSLRIKSMKQDK